MVDILLSMPVFYFYVVFVGGLLAAALLTRENDASVDNPDSPATSRHESAQNGGRRRSGLDPAFVRYRNPNQRGIRCLAGSRSLTLRWLRVRLEQGKVLRKHGGRISS